MESKGIHLPVKIYHRDDNKQTNKPIVDLHNTDFAKWVLENEEVLKIVGPRDLNWKMYQAWALHDWQTKLRLDTVFNGHF